MTPRSKASPSATLRFIGALTAIGALFFGFAALAITGDSKVELATGSTTSSTSSTTTSTTTSSGSGPLLTSPSPSIERVTGPETSVIDGVGDGISPSTTVVVDPTAPATSPPSTPTTAPKPTTTTVPSGDSTTPPPPTEVPDGAIIVNPGDNIQQLVNSHPAGTTFYLRAGVHKSPGGTRHVDPKSDSTFIGEPGAVMDGGGATTFAFQDNMKGSNVTVRGLIIQNYSTPQQRGAIDAGSGGWKVIGNEIRNNAGAGVAFGGSGWVIEGNNIHHNEQIGVKGQGTGRVVNNTIANNNPNRRFDPAWEAGGTKFVNTTNLHVAGNKVLNNHGPGLWTDGNNKGTVYENNTVRDNYGPGIFHEISQSAAIRNNTVTGNAHGFYLGGILVANSSDVTVTGNSVSGNNGGVVGLQDDRGSHNTVNLVVKKNAVSFSTGLQGVVHNSGTDVTQTGTIIFDENSYTTAVAKPFRWGKVTLTAPEWQAIGQDPNSTFG